MIATASRVERDDDGEGAILTQVTFLSVIIIPINCK